MCIWVFAYLCVCVCVCVCDTYMGEARCTCHHIYMGHIYIYGAPWCPRVINIYRRGSVHVSSYIYGTYLHIWSTMVSQWYQHIWVRHSARVIIYIWDISIYIWDISIYIEHHGVPGVSTYMGEVQCTYRCVTTGVCVMGWL